MKFYYLRLINCDSSSIAAKFLGASKHSRNCKFPFCQTLGVQEIDSLGFSFNLTARRSISNWLRHPLKYWARSDIGQKRLISGNLGSCEITA